MNKRRVPVLKRTGTLHILPVGCLEGIASPRAVAPSGVASIHPFPYIAAGYATMIIPALAHNVKKAP